MAHVNRRRKPTGFIIPLHVAWIMALVVILFLMYVCFDVRGKALGMRIKVLEQQQDEIQKQYSYELWKWQKMKSPSNIEYMLSHNNLAMVLPGESSIVRLQQPDKQAEAFSKLAGKVEQFAQSSRSEVND